MALREDGVVLRREKLIFEKALPVVVALPRKGVEQDVGGRLLDVLPVGGIPQPRTGCSLPYRPEQRPHGLGDAAHEGEQAGGLLGRGADDEVFQRKAVEEDIAAHGQLSCPGSQAAQPAAVVECAAADDPQTLRQGDFFQEVPADGVELVVLRRGSGGVEVKAVPLFAAHIPAKSTGQTELAVLGPLIAAGLFRPGQTPGLFGKTVISQFGDGPPALPFRRRNSPGQLYAGLTAVHPHKAGRAARQRQNIQYHKNLAHKKAAAQTRRAAAPFKTSSLCGLCKAIVHCRKYRVAGHGAAGDSIHSDGRASRQQGG